MPCHFLYASTSKWTFWKAESAVHVLLTLIFCACYVTRNFLRYQNGAKKANLKETWTLASLEKKSQEQLFMDYFSTFAPKLLNLPPSNVHVLKTNGLFLLQRDQLKQMSETQHEWKTITIQKNVESSLIFFTGNLNQRAELAR